MAATTEPKMDDETLPSGSASDVPARGGEGGFFSFYKRGQGYWTRMGTAIGVALLLAFTLLFLYRELLPHFSVNRNAVKLTVTGIFAVVTILAAWWLMNGARRAQFMIDTDSEMKKVNWASRAELVASTKVVILFMVLIALALFVFDQQFHGLFYLIGYTHAGLNQRIRVYSVPIQPLLMQVSGLLFTSVLTAVGQLIRHGADNPRAKFWGTVMLVVGLVGLVAWAGWTVTTVAGGGALSPSTAPVTSGL